MSKVRTPHYVLFHLISQLSQVEPCLGYKGFTLQHLLPTTMYRGISHERPKFHVRVVPLEASLTLAYVKLLIESACQGPPSYRHGFQLLLQNISSHLLSQYRQL